MELLGAALVLLVPAIAVFSGRVLHGGFAYDDWALAASFQHLGVLQNIHAIFLLENTRPLQGPYAVIYAIVGDHQRSLLLWAAFTRTGVSWALYLLMRTLGLARLPAIAIAILVLLTPASDALWLWGNAAILSVTIILYLLGTVAVLNALASSRPRRARALHVVGLVLYLMSVLLYEIAAVAILASIALYLVRAPRRAAVRRWLLDVTCTALVLLFITSGKLHVLPGSDVHPSIPLSQWPGHLKLILDQGAHILASAAVPFGLPNTLLVCLGLLAIALIGLVASRLPRYGSAPRRWVGIGVAGIVAAIIGWAPFIPAVSYYSPGTLGVGNRVNALAMVGISVTVFAAAMVVGLVVLGWRSRTWAVGVAVILAAVVLGGYAHLDGIDRAAWGTATQLSQDELADMRTALGKPPPRNSTIYLFGGTEWAGAGIPVFAAQWDFNGAVQVTWHDSTLGGVPMLPGMSIVCGKTTLYPTGDGYGLAQLEPYRRAIFVGLPGSGTASTTVARLSNRSQCESATHRLPAG